MKAWVGGILKKVLRADLNSQTLLMDTCAYTRIDCIILGHIYPRDQLMRSIWTDEGSIPEGQSELVTQPGCGIMLRIKACSQYLGIGLQGLIL